MRCFQMNFEYVTQSRVDVIYISQVARRGYEFGIFLSEPVIYMSYFIILRLSGKCTYVMCMTSPFSGSYPGW